MTIVPAEPKIYHITHVRNLAQISNAGVVWSDAKRIELGLSCEVIGMSEIKRRRLDEIVVHCHPGTKVGQYVPFYFCPRSIMLYILHCGNHPDITHREGQASIVHLQADLYKTIQWANTNGIGWAFSDRNAGSYLSGFFNRTEDFEKINWDAVAQRDFRDIVVKEGKQAEFLVFESFPWSCVDKVGVATNAGLEQVQAALASASHRPTASVETQWYF